MLTIGTLAVCLFVLFLTGAFAVGFARYLRPQPFEQPKPARPLELDISDPPCRCGAYQPVDSKRLACFWCGRLLDGAIAQASDGGPGEAA